jgi:hypothetical protein
MQVEVFLEVATLDISMPLMVALDGGAVVFITTVAVDFLPEVHHCVACHQCVMLRRCLRHEWRAPLTERATTAQMVGAISLDVVC